MRPIAFTIIGFIYILSISAALVDTMILQELNIRPVGLSGKVFDPQELVDEFEAMAGLTNSTLNVNDGNIFDRIHDFAFWGFASISAVLELLAGVYFFNVLELIGVPVAFVVALKLIFPMFVAFQVIRLVTGRS